MSNVLKGICSARLTRESCVTARKPCRSSADVNETSSGRDCWLTYHARAQSSAEAPVHAESRIHHCLVTEGHLHARTGHADAPAVYLTGVNPGAVLVRDHRRRVSPGRSCGWAGGLAAKPVGWTADLTATLLPAALVKSMKLRILHPSGEPP